MKITIVKSILNDRPRYRVVEDEIKSDEDLSKIPQDLKVTRSFKNAAAVAVAIALRNGAKIELSVYETKVELKDPSHKKDSESDK